jgi:hypothetical protein
VCGRAVGPIDRILRPQLDGLGVAHHSRRIVLIWCREGGGLARPGDQVFGEGGQQDERDAGASAATAVVDRLAKNHKARCEPPAITEVCYIYC